MKTQTLDTQSLSAYLALHIPGFQGPVRAEKFAGGQSNPTFKLSSANNQHYVLRRKPPGELLKSAHAVDREFRVISALREASRKLGRVRLADATIFATHEPCAMCIGALLQSDVEALVFAMHDEREGAAGSVIQLAQHASLPRQIKIVSGIRRDEAAALFETVALR
mgnify:CR=1 FL=1